MKRILISLACILFCMNSYAQIPVEDAVRLKALIDANSKVFETSNSAAVENILRKYTNGSIGYL